jgi:cytochrome c oxidase subunit IV
MEQHATAHPSIKTYLLVFAALGVLTGLTVAISYMGLSHGMGIFAAGLIAATKCTLIAAFFMHLRSETRGITYTMLVALFLVVVLIGALIPDVGIVRK